MAHEDEDDRPTETEAREYLLQIARDSGSTDAGVPASSIRSFRDLVHLAAVFQSRAPMRGKVTEGLRSLRPETLASLARRFGRGLRSGHVPRLPLEEIAEVGEVAGRRPLSLAPGEFDAVVGEALARLSIRAAPLARPRILDLAGREYLPLPGVISLALRSAADPEAPFRRGGAGHLTPEELDALVELWRAWELDPGGRMQRRLLLWLIQERVANNAYSRTDRCGFLHLLALHLHRFPDMRPVLVQALGGTPPAQHLEQHLHSITAGPRSPERQVHARRACLSFWRSGHRPLIGQEVGLSRRSGYQRCWERRMKEFLPHAKLGERTARIDRELARISNRQI